MSASDDTDVLMQLVRAKLEAITGNDSYNALTPAVREHYRGILQRLVDEWFAGVGKEHL